MGRQHMLKPQLLLPLFVLIVVMVGLGSAIYFISLPQQRATGAVFNDPSENYQTSDAGGTIQVATTVKDAQGNIIRRVTPADYLMGASIVDPATNEEVTYYTIELAYSCWGKSIDWTTFNLQGTWTFSAYVGVDGAGNQLQRSFNTQLGQASEINPEVATEMRADGTLTGRELINGTLVFPDVDISTLMPDTITVSWLEYMDDGTKERMYEHYSQKTAWTHAMNFVFDCEFSMSVNDDYGNPYTSPYQLHLDIKLIWAGSDFNMQWGSSSSGAPSSQGAAPDPTQAAPASTDEGSDVEPIDPRDSIGDPVRQLTSGESMYMSSDRSSDVFAAALTGAQGSLLITIGATMFILPVVFFWWSRRR